MSLTQEQIAHIARLSKLKPSPEELEKYRENLSSVVEYVDQLSKIPASMLEGIEISSSLICPLREDAVVSQGQGKPTRKELLSCSPQRVVSDQIAIPNIMG